MARGNSYRESFLWRWIKAVRSSTLPSKAKLVAHTLSTHMNYDGGECFPSIELLMAETSTARDTVSKALDVLERDGWIVRRRHSTKTAGRFGGRNHPTRYQAFIPEQSEYRTVTSENPSDNRTVDNEKQSDTAAQSVQSSGINSPTTGLEGYPEGTHEGQERASRWNPNPDCPECGHTEARLCTRCSKYAQGAA